MTENIKLQQVMIDRMVLEMRCYDIRRHIICRLLDRCEGIDLLMPWKNDHTTRMLSGRTLNAGTSDCQTFHLTASFRDDSLFIDIFLDLLLGQISHCRSFCSRFILCKIFEVIIYITIRCLICYRCYSSCTECLTLTE